MPQEPVWKTSRVFPSEQWQYRDWITTGGERRWDLRYTCASGGKPMEFGTFTDWAELLREVENTELSWDNEYNKHLAEVDVHEGFADEEGDL